MTEFSSSTAIGGVFVTVDLDESKLDSKLGALPSKLSKVEKNLRMKVGGGGGGPAWNPGGGNGYVMAPTSAQQAAKAYGANWPMGAGGGGNGTTVGGRAGAPGWQPGGGGGGGGAGTGGGTGKGIGRNVNLFSRGVTAYGIAAATEGVTDFASSALEASKALKFAANDNERIAAMIKARQSGEAALSKVPIFGSLMVSARRLIDTVNGNSPEDIARTQEEAAQINERQSNRYLSSGANRIAMASGYAASFPNRSFGAESNVITAQLNAKLMAQGMERNVINEKYQYTDAQSQRAPFSGPIDWYFKKDQYQSEADRFNDEQDKKKKIELASVNERDQTAQIEAKAARAQLDFAKKNLTMHLQSSESVANLTVQRRYASAELKQKFDSFDAEMFNAPKELKDSTRNMLPSAPKLSRAAAKPPGRRPARLELPTYQDRPYLDFHGIGDHKAFVITRGHESLICSPASPRVAGDLVGVAYTGADGNMVLLAGRWFPQVDGSLFIAADPVSIDDEPKVTCIPSALVLKLGTVVEIRSRPMFGEGSDGIINAHNLMDSSINRFRAQAAVTAEIDARIELSPAAEKLLAR